MVIDPQVAAAFEKPEDYEWGNPTSIEQFLFDVISNPDKTFILHQWSQWDRKTMEDLINQNKREAVRFSSNGRGPLMVGVVK